MHILYGMRELGFCVATLRLGIKISLEWVELLEIGVKV